MPLPAKRLSALPTYFFATLGQRIQALKSQGIDVISLDIGSPDLPPPPAVIETLHEFARRDDTHGYTGYVGLPNYRAAVAHYYQRRFGVELDPSREVLPLLGSKEGIVNLALAYLDTGDKALVPDIAYPSYAMGTRLAGGDVNWIPMSHEDRFLIKVDQIPSASLQSAKLLWVNYPNNPTGATTELQDYQHMVDFCREHQLILASDNPYVDVTYDDFAAPSALQAQNAKECTIEFMSLSKTFNMGGWRLGAAVGNAEILKTLLQVKSNVDSGHFRPIYEAGTIALNTTPLEWIKTRNQVYQRRRDRIMQTLPHIGLQADNPKGSLYIWAKTANGDGERYVDTALNEAHVAFAPGGAYGPGGQAYIRISLGISDERLEQALDRLTHWYHQSSLV
jgi:LL-diaminopimelate aminotransferase